MKGQLRAWTRISRQRNRTLTDVDVLPPQRHQGQEEDFSVDTPETDRRLDRGKERTRVDPGGDRPLPLAALRTPFDLPDQQVDGPVNVVGLDVPNDGVEEGPDLLVVSRSQRSLLLHWKQIHSCQRSASFMVVDAALHCGGKKNPNQTSEPVKTGITGSSAHNIDKCLHLVATSANSTH